MRNPSASMNDGRPPVIKRSEVRKKARGIVLATVIPKNKNMLDTRITKIETILIWRSESSTSKLANLYLNTIAL